MTTPLRKTVLSPLFVRGFAVATLALTAAAGCSDDPQAEDPTLTTPQEAALSFCQATHARAVSCGDDTGELSEKELEDCIDGSVCSFESVREDARQAVVDCWGERACDAKPDACAFADELGIVESAASKDFTTACLARRDECAQPPAESSFGDDVCFSELLKDDGFASLNACLLSDCASVEACLQMAQSAPGTCQ